MSKKFSFGLKSFPSQSHLVVHRKADGTMTTAVAGFDDPTSARIDAEDRTGRDKIMGLDCTYVVCDRTDGEGVKEEVKKK